MPELITPAYDNKIYQKFSKKTIQNKKENKILFCEEFELTYDKRTPILCITFELIEENNIQILQNIMDGILEQNIQLVLLGIGNKKYQEYFTKLMQKNSDKITVVENNEINKRKVYSGSDMFLMLNDNKECKEEATNAMRYGVVPIAIESEFTENYDAIKESGNSFIYKKESPWSLFATIIKSMENFKFPYDWKNIQTSAMDVK